MRENLTTSMRFLLAHEGGFVNHPKDPGGATNRGVTQRVYDAFRDRIGQPRRSVRGIANDEVAEIYARQYWHPIRGDDLPSGLDYAVFDFAVNSGVKRAAIELQRILGVKADGVIGEVTLAKIADADAFDLIERLCNRRLEFCKGLEHWSTFGKGWTARIMGESAGWQIDDIGVIDRAVAMASGEADGLPAPRTARPGKAEAVDRESPAESTTVQASVLQIASGAGGAVATAGSFLGGLGEWAQIVAIAAFAVMTLAAIWIMRERLRKWAEGVR